MISTALATYSVTPDSGNDGILAGGRLRCFDSTAGKRVALTIFLSVISFLVVIITLVMYALIFVVVHKRQRMLRNGELGETSTGQNQRSFFRQDLKTVRMLVIVVGEFFFCWLIPLGIWHLLNW